MERKKFLKLLPGGIAGLLSIGMGVAIKGSPKPNPGNPIKCGSWSTCLAEVGGNPRILLTWCMQCPPKPGDPI